MCRVPGCDRAPVSALSGGLRGQPPRSPSVTERLSYRGLRLRLVLLRLLVPLWLPLLTALEGRAEHTMSLSAFIRDHHEDIISEFAVFAKTLMPPGADMTAAELRDHEARRHVVDYLTWLLETLVDSVSPRRCGTVPGLTSLGRGTRQSRRGKLDRQRRRGLVRPGPIPSRASRSSRL
jgi:hypothetical protein